MSTRSGDRPVGKTKAAVVLSVASTVFLILAVVGIILFREYLSDAERVRAAIGEHYLLGALALILLCAVQVVVALIPGELLEFAAGYVFGPWWGALFCLLGIVLGSVAVLFLVSRLGARFVYAFYPKEKLEKLPILRSPRQRNALVLVLFLIPGTPKDFLTYGIGLTDMSIPLYLLLTTAARFPSVITSTWGGSAVGDDSYRTAIIIYAVTLVVSGCGLLIYNRIVKAHEKRALSVPSADGSDAAAAEASAAEVSAAETSAAEASVEASSEASADASENVPAEVPPEALGSTGADTDGDPCAETRRGAEPGAKRQA